MVVDFRPFFVDCVHNTRLVCINNLFGCGQRRWRINLTHLANYPFPDWLLLSKLSYNQKTLIALYNSDSCLVSNQFACIVHICHTYIYFWCIWSALWWALFVYFQVWQSKINIVLVVNIVDAFGRPFLYISKSGMTKWCLGCGAASPAFQDFKVKFGKYETHYRTSIGKSTLNVSRSRRSKIK